MAEEEKKKKKKKKFKPVIEEIVPEDDQSQEPSPVVEEETSTDEEQAHAQEEAVSEEQDTPQEDEIKHPVHTYPTNDESLEVSNIDQQEKPKKQGFKLNLSFFFIMIAVAIFVAVVSGALYVYFNGVTSISTGGSQATPVATYPPQTTPMPTSAATPVPSASPAALDSLKVSVLNGSGKAGEAGKAASLLKNAGFSITQTSNASSFDFAQTVVQVKSGVPSTVILAVEDALKGTYSVATGDALAASSAYDVIVTVGAK